MNNLSVFSELESAVRSYCRAFPRKFDRAINAEMWDTDDNRYLDFLSGAGSLNYGHNNPIFKQALIDYIERDAITHSLDLHTIAKEQFLVAFQEIVLDPRGLDYVVQFTGPTGANAVEAALKIARKATGRNDVIFFTNGFHGVTMGALAVTANQYFRDAAGVPLVGTTPMPYDGYMGEGIDTLAYFQRMLEDPSSGLALPAAVIVECVQGEGGLNVADASWLRGLQALCREHGILLIVDDIQAGCGRAGSFFSFESAGITPDIITLSKSLSGYGIPFSIVLLNRDVDVWKPAEHNGTFRGHNLAFVTATAALETYWRTNEFEQNIYVKGQHIVQRLQTIIEQYPDDFVCVRGKGMMIGIECVDPKRAGNITKRAFEHGLIIERAGPWDEVIKCMMPLTISYEHIDEGLDMLALAINDEYGDPFATLSNRRAVDVAYAADLPIPA